MQFALLEFGSAPEAPEYAVGRAGGYRNMAVLRRASDAVATPVRRGRVVDAEIEAAQQAACRREKSSLASRAAGRRAEEGSESGGVPYTRELRGKRRRTRGRPRPSSCVATASTRYSWPGVPPSPCPAEPPAAAEFGRFRAARDIPALDWTRPLQQQIVSELSFDYGSAYWGLHRQLGSSDVPLVVDGSARAWTRSLS